MSAVLLLAAGPAASAFAGCLFGASSEGEKSNVESLLQSARRQTLLNGLNPLDWEETGEIPAGYGELLRPDPEYAALLARVLEADQATLDAEFELVKRYVRGMEGEQA